MMTATDHALYQAINDRVPYGDTAEDAVARKYARRAIAKLLPHEKAALKASTNRIPAEDVIVLDRYRAFPLHWPTSRRPTPRQIDRAAKWARAFVLDLMARLLRADQEARASAKATARLVLRHAFGVDRLPDGPPTLLGGSDA